MTADDKRRSAHVVEVLPEDRVEAAVTVLCDAFYDYPVMRHVVGEAGDDYDVRLRALVGFFVAARVLREEPMLAVIDEDLVVAVAILSSPGEREAPPDLAERREVVWAELGVAARERYEALGHIWQQFTIPDPHYHLNMIGVCRSHSGRGLGGLLLDAVHELSQRESGSCGVSLTTEDPANVSLYEHYGYEIVGHAICSPEYETWGFFRRD